MAVPRSRFALAVTALIVAFVLAGCIEASEQPQPTPADFTGIAQHLAKTGITVRDVVSGDAGCSDPTLAPTAIAFSASGLDQTQPVRIRVYIFRTREAWGRLAGSVAACARSYVTDAATYESVSPSPFIVSGQGPWAPLFAAALGSGFTAAAGSGG
jgi:hypothetical protein